MEGKNSKRLYNKLLFIDSLILLGIVTALVAYFITSTKSRILDTNLEYMEMMCAEAADYVEQCADSVDYIHKDLYKSAMELQDMLHYMSDGPEEYWRYRLNTFSLLEGQDYKGFDDFVENIFVAYPDVSLVEIISYEKPEITECYPDDKRYLVKDAPEGVARRLRQAEEGDLAGEGSFSFQKEIKDPDNLRSVGCMIVTFPAQRLAGIQQTYPRGELFFYNQAGSVILGAAKTAGAQGLPAAVEEGRAEEYLHSFVQEKTVRDYTLLAYFPKGRASALPWSAFLAIIAVGAAVFAAGEALVRYHLKNLTGRLSGILDGMERVTTGDLSVRLQGDPEGDELDVISYHFNGMCEKLDTYIRKSYLAQIEQKNAQMEALQSQINPHFLYNTLESIRMKAICNGDREVGRMLYSMAVIFRSQIKDDNQITLVKELHYCKKYLELFEFRYQGKFVSSVECPEELMSCRVIKFLLQPVIENYFIHGMRMEETDNRIRITACADGGDLLIHVEDNGLGMGREEMEEKNRELLEDQADIKKSIGLANVNRRIRAVYGEGYGLTLLPGESGGLRVVLRLTLDRTDEGKETGE